MYAFKFPSYLLAFTDVCPGAPVLFYFILFPPTEYGLRFVFDVRPNVPMCSAETAPLWS
jgi:hypothetical protein